MNQAHPELPAPEDVERTLSDASREWAQLAAQERKAVANYKSNPGPGAGLVLGVTYAQAENYERARDFLVPVLQAQPGEAVAWSWLGVERLGSGHVEEAEAVFRHTIDLDPELALGWRGLGGLLMDRGDEGEAFTVLERANELEPNRPEVAMDLARLLEARGEVERAGEILEVARRADVWNPSLLFLLARVRRAEGRTLEAEALEARHARAIQIDDLGLRGAGLSPQRVALALGIHYVESGQPELALEEFGTAAGRGGDGEAIGMALGGRVDALVKLGRLEEAREALSELRSFDSRHPMLESVEAALAAAEEAGQ